MARQLSIHLDLFLDELPNSSFTTSKVHTIAGYQVRRFKSDVEFLRWLSEAVILLNAKRG